MTDFNYFDDWGLEGGWADTQNADYAPLWDSFNTGVTAQVPTFGQDNDYWDMNKPELQYGGDVQGYQYALANLGGNTDPFYSDLGFNPRQDLSLDWTKGQSPRNQFDQAMASGGPMPGFLAGGMPNQQQAGLASSDYTEQRPGFMDQISGYANKAQDWLKSNPGLARLGLGMIGAYKDYNAAQDKQKLAAQMMSKFGNPNAAMYAAGHKNYYQNPGEWMNSPYVQVPYQQAAKEYMAKMTAQGRTNPNELAYTQAQMLNDMASKSYNNWMQTSYPWGQENANLIGPYSQLMNQANVSEYNQYNDILKELYRMSGIPQEDIGTTQRVDNDKTLQALYKVLGIV